MQRLEPLHAWLYDHLECVLLGLLLGGVLWAVLAYPPRCVQTTEKTYSLPVPSVPA